MILSITGPSGVGKTTLMHNLLGVLPGAKPLTSVTTRSPRPTDEPGEYEYVSQEEFDAIADAGAFLWQARAYINRYGTRKAIIDEALASPTLYLPALVIDAVKTLHAYAAEVGKTEAVRSLYLHIQDESELRARFTERGDKPEEAEARIAECRSWNKNAKESGVPFIYLEATKTREEIVENALVQLRLVGYL